MKSRSLTGNFIMNFIKTITNLLFPIVTFAYASRILGAEGIGIVSYTDSIMKYFILIGGSGITFYGIREIAKVRDNKEQLEKTVGELLVLNLLMTGISYMMLLVLLRLPAGRQYMELFMIQGSILLFNAFGMEWLYNAMEEYTYITVRTVAFQLTAFIALLVFVRKEEDYISYAAICVFALAGAQLMNFLHARKYFRVFGSGVRLQIGKHLKPMKYIFGANLAISVYLHVDKTMLGAMVSTNAVGLYAAANHITRVVAGLLTCITNVVLPRISYYFENDKKEEAFRLIADSGNMILMLVIPASVGLACISESVIWLVCGAEFTGAYKTLMVLAVSAAFSVYNNYWVWQIFVPLNREKLVFTGTMASALVNIILNFILIPFYGMLGAAVSTLTAELALTVLCMVWGRKVLPLHSILCRIPQYLAAGAGILFTCLLLDSWMEKSVFSMCIKIVVSVAVYLLALHLMKNEYLYKMLNAIRHLRREG